MATALVITQKNITVANTTALLLNFKCLFIYYA